MEADLVIVGGGPAGLATALHARHRGLEVVVLDRARPPVDKPCGEGLMPDGVEHLRALGVSLPGGEARHPFRGIRYLTEDPALDGPLVAEGRFPGGAIGQGIRRTALHRAMAGRAEAAGVHLLWGERAEVLVGLERGGPPVGVRGSSGETHLGRWLVGADGLRSQVRGWARLGSAPGDRPPGPEEGEVRSARGRFGVRRHFAAPPWGDLVEVHWGERCEAYVTPVGRETVGVAMLWSPHRDAAGGFDELLDRFPRLRERLAGAPPASSDRGCGPLARRVRSVARGRVALVGDASGYLDAITGEGLSLAFHQAAALVETVAEAERTDPGDRAAAPLAPYERAHRRIRRLPELLVRLLLFAERRPALRLRLIRALADDPGLFDRLLGLHARSIRPLSPVGVGAAVRLARRLVLASV